MRAFAAGALQMEIPTEFWHGISTDDMERLCATGIMPPDQVVRLCRFVGVSPIPQGEVKVQVERAELQELLDEIGPPIKLERTNAEAIVAEGVTFYCYRTEVRPPRFRSTIQWQSADGGLHVERSTGKTTFSASADERMLIDETGKWARFQTLKAAMVAAVKARRRSKAVGG